MTWRMVNFIMRLTRQLAVIIVPFGKLANLLSVSYQIYNMLSTEGDKIKE